MPSLTNIIAIFLVAEKLKDKGASFSLENYAWFELPLPKERGKSAVNKLKDLDVYVTYRRGKLKISGSIDNVAEAVARLVKFDPISIARNVVSKISQ